MSKKYPSLVHVATLTDSRKGQTAVCLKTPRGDKWVAARSLGYPSFRSRIRLAWMVFTGKADALIWEQQ